jgi:2'-5' RNA ligase
MTDTAIVILVPEAEPLIGAHRRAHTTEGAHGMGAHVTLLYPFVAAAELDMRVLDVASEALAPFESFDFSLAAATRFPENARVLCLRPESDDRFRAMTAALVAAFPEHEPYGGRYADPVPHMTVAIGDDAVLDSIERELTPSLPLAARATSAVVMHRPGGGAWRIYVELPFL